ncbi:hypothetical protein [Larkinella terrae]|uniref:Uncharacterized protein n=1 Tax=Larkinella terrae TaxID=2025311 RepID=A0A7K0EUT5_9BACT|nr:hypothetical protein [Larkinella terrae]MRS65519.1 hypothetical protein [Larkinella terrae]
MNAYKAFADLISASVSSDQTMAFKASDEMRSRFYDLLSKEKAGFATEEDKEELNHFMELEHIVRMAKAKKVV